MEEKSLRFDMHVAYRSKCLETLIEWVSLVNNCLLFKNSLLSSSSVIIYRPRYGVFVQSKKCAEYNISGENLIPTFTCNFFATSFLHAEQIKESIMTIMFTTLPLLKKYFLRVRVEGQGCSVKYNPILKTLQYIVEPSEYYKQHIPLNVTGSQYYDAHIHLTGIINNDIYYGTAQIAAQHNLPLITNIFKENPKPFITIRWYNIDLQSALTSLNSMYNILYVKLLDINVQMDFIPHFEVTLIDPDCQVTDKGWMPIPEYPFKITNEYCCAPKELSIKL